MNQEEKEVIIQHLEELKRGLPIEVIRKFNIDSKYLRRTRPTINGKRESLYKLTDEAIKQIDRETEPIEISSFMSSDSSTTEYAKYNKVYNAILNADCQYPDIKSRVMLIRKNFNKMVEGKITYDDLVMDDILDMMSRYLKYDSVNDTYSLKPEIKLSLTKIIMKFCQPTKDEEDDFAKLVYEKHGAFSERAKADICITVYVQYLIMSNMILKDI